MSKSLTRWVIVLAALFVFAREANRLLDEGRTPGRGALSVLELAEVSDRVMKSPAPHGHSERDKHVHADKGGRALIFENVKGSDIPLAINTFGSYWRMEQALGQAQGAGQARQVGPYTVVPDASGMEVLDGAVFGFKRLSIIEVAEPNWLAGSNRRRRASGGTSAASEACESISPRTKK